MSKETRNGESEQSFKTDCISEEILEMKRLFIPTSNLKFDFTKNNKNHKWEPYGFC